MSVSIIASAALIAVSPTCSWDNPGANRYTGSIPAAVQHYKDIPKSVRDRLQARMEKRDYDEIADISRDNISGSSNYSNLRDMHFGTNRMCQTVTRDKWAPSAKERGLIYCEDEHCIIVPTVCGNVSRVTKLAPPPPPTPPATPGGSSGPTPAPIAPTPFWEEPTFQSRQLQDPVPPLPLVPDEYSPRFPPIDSYVPGPGGGGCCWIIPPFIPPEIPPEIPPIPEPSTMLLFLSGLIGIVVFRRHKRQR